MAVKIGSARIDENGRAHGGKAGDQTGRELSTQDWEDHKKGWVLLRPKSPAQAELIAANMEAACKNSKIGYDQYQRNTLYEVSKPLGFDCSKVTTACETDCSALVRVCCCYAGLLVGNFRTTDEARILMATGAFDKFTGAQYTKRSDYLRRGDILVTKTQGHTVVVLTNGSKAAPLSLGERVLKYGCVGEDVRALQAQLIAWGYDLGSYGADGDFGACTRSALRAFQKDERLNVTGEYDVATHSALVERAALGPIVPAQPEAPDATLFPVRGFLPDISANQGSIDLSAFAAGNDFAIFRARVSGKDDEKFDAWAKGLTERGFPFAAYDYVKLKSVKDAVEQAEAMYKKCAPYKPRIYYLDTEKRAIGVGYKREFIYIRAYVDRLRALGVKVVGQYTGDYRWRKHYHEISHLFDTLWLANWGKNTGYLSALPKAQHAKIHLHQYTSFGYAKSPGAPGIKHRIDLNRLTGRAPLSFFTGREHGGTGYYGVVKTTAEVNARSSGSIAAVKLGAIPKDTLLMRRGGDVLDWVAVYYQGKEAYVSRKYVVEVKEG